MNIKKCLSIGIISSIMYISCITPYSVLAMPKVGEVTLYEADNFSEANNWNENELWQGNMNQTKLFYVKNDSKSSIAIKGISFNHESTRNYEKNKELTFQDKEFIELTKNSKVIIYHGKENIYNGNLKDTLEAKNLSLYKDVIVNKGEEAPITVTIHLGKDTNNLAQGLEHSISMSINYTLNNGNDTNNPEIPDNEENPSLDGENNNGNSSDKLPVTGEIVALSTVGLGLLFMGAFIFKPLKKEEKSNE